MQLVPAVTELMVAELLYLEKQGQQLPIEMLINSSGTTRQDGEIVSSLRLCTALVHASKRPTLLAPGGISRWRAAVATCTRPEDLHAFVAST